MSIDTGLGRTFNENYPVPGINQSTQQFRDNFAIIRGALENLQQASEDGSSILSMSLATSPVDGSVRFKIGFPVTTNTSTLTAGTMRFSGGTLQFWDGRAWAQIVTANATGVAGTVNISANAVTAAMFSGNAVSVRSCVAQRFAADAIYPTGSVLIYGGVNDVTVTNVAADSRVAGVIVDSPAYTLDDVLSDPSCPYVALLGGALCRVLGPVAKGDILVTSTTPGVAVAEPVISVGAIIGKATSDKTSLDEGLVSISVQRS